MRCGGDATQPEEDEHSCAKRPEAGASKEVECGDDHGSNSEDDHDGKIDNLGLPVAIEAEVEPRDKRTHCQEGDSTVIESGGEKVMKLGA